MFDNIIHFGNYYNQRKKELLSALRKKADFFHPIVHLKITLIKFYQCLINILNSNPSFDGHLKKPAHGYMMVSMAARM